MELRVEVAEPRRALGLRKVRFEERRQFAEEEELVLEADRVAREGPHAQQRRERVPAEVEVEAVHEGQRLLERPLELRRRRKGLLDQARQGQRLELLAVLGFLDGGHQRQQLLLQPRAQPLLEPLRARGAQRGAQDAGGQQDVGAGLVLVVVGQEVEQRVQVGRVAQEVLVQQLLVAHVDVHQLRVAREHRVEEAQENEQQRVVLGLVSPP